MSKLQRRPEPLARKLSLLKLRLESRRTRQFLLGQKFVASGSKTLGSTSSLVFGAIAALREAHRASAWSSSVLNIAVTNLCHFARPRKSPQLRSGTRPHFATKRPQGTRRARFESS